MKAEGTALETYSYNLLYYYIGSYIYNYITLLLLLFFYFQNSFNDFVNIYEYIEMSIGICHRSIIIIDIYLYSNKLHCIIWQL